MPKSGSSSTKYHGVSYQEDRKGWRARIIIGRKKIYVPGVFDTAKDAAKAYDIELKRTDQIAAADKGPGKKFAYNLGEPTASELANGYKSRTLEHPRNPRGVYVNQRDGTLLNIKYNRPNGKIVTISKVGEESSPADWERAYKAHDCAIFLDQEMKEQDKLAQYNYGVPNSEQIEKYQRLLAERAALKAGRKVIRKYPQYTRPMRLKNGTLRWNLKIDKSLGTFNHLEDALAVRNEFIKKKGGVIPEDTGITVESAIAIAQIECVFVPRKQKLKKEKSSSAASPSTAAVLAAEQATPVVLQHSTAQEHASLLPGPSEGMFFAYQGETDSFAELGIDIVKPGLDLDLYYETDPVTRAKSPQFRLPSDELPHDFDINVLFEELTDSPSSASSSSSQPPSLQAHKPPTPPPAAKRRKR